MRVMIYRGQGKTNEAIQAQNVYNAWVAEMTAFMKARYQQPLKKTRTNLCSYR